MAASRSVYPWDIIVQIVGKSDEQKKKIFFDKRNRSELGLSYFGSVSKDCFDDSCVLPQIS